MEEEGRGGEGRERLKEEGRGGGETDGTDG